MMLRLAYLIFCQLSALARLLSKVRHRQLFVTPGTLLRWHSDVITRRGTTQRQRSEHPPTSPSLRRVIRHLASENPGGGYRRIAGELAGMGRQVGACTVWAILKRARINTASRRSVPTRGRVPARPREGDLGDHVAQFTFVIRARGSKFTCRVPEVGHSRGPGE
jgi:hypothetical protein